MSYSHAVVWMDHREACLIHFNADRHESERIHATEGKEHLHHRAGTLGDGRAKRHPAYFKGIVAALEGVSEVLLVGPGTAKNEFVHFLGASEPVLHAKILGVESADQLSEPKLLAMARDWFVPVDRMRATPLR